MMGYNIYFFIISHVISDQSNIIKRFEWRGWIWILYIKISNIIGGSCNFLDYHLMWFGFWNSIFNPSFHPLVLQMTLYSSFEGRVIWYAEQSPWRGAPKPRFSRWQNLILLLTVDKSSVFFFFAFELSKWAFFEYRNYMTAIVPFLNHCSPSPFKSFSPISHGLYEECVLFCCRVILRSIFKFYNIKFSCIIKFRNSFYNYY